MGSSPAAVVPSGLPEDEYWGVSMYSESILLIQSLHLGPSQDPYPVQGELRRKLVLFELGGKPPLKSCIFSQPKDNPDDYS